MSPSCGARPCACASRLGGGPRGAHAVCIGAPCGCLAPPVDRGLVRGAGGRAGSAAPGCGRSRAPPGGAASAPAFSAAMVGDQDTNAGTGDEGAGEATAEEARGALAFAACSHAATCQAARASLRAGASVAEVQVHVQATAALVGDYECEPEDDPVLEQLSQAAKMAAPGAPKRSATELQRALAEEKAAVALARAMERWGGGPLPRSITQRGADGLYREARAAVQAAAPRMPFHLLCLSVDAMHALHQWRTEVSRQETNEANRLRVIRFLRPYIECLREAPSPQATYGCPPPPDQLPALSLLERGIAAWVVGWAVRTLRSRSEKNSSAEQRRMVDVLRTFQISSRDDDECDKGWYAWTRARDAAVTSETFDVEDGEGGLRGVVYVHKEVIQALVPLMKLCSWAFKLKPLPRGVAETTRQLYLHGRAETQKEWVALAARRGIDVTSETQMAALHGVVKRLAVKIIHVFGGQLLRRSNATRAEAALRERLKHKADKGDGKKKQVRATRYNDEVVAAIAAMEAEADEIRGRMLEDEAPVEYERLGFSLNSLGDVVPVNRDVWGRMQERMRGIGVEASREEIRAAVLKHCDVSAGGFWIMALRDASDLPVTHLWALELEDARRGLASVEALAALGDSGPAALQEHVSKIWSALNRNKTRTLWKENQIDLAVRRARAKLDRPPPPPPQVEQPIKKGPAKKLSASVSAARRQAFQESQASHSQL